MRPAVLAALVCLAPGCVWISDKTFDEAWDADADEWGIDDDCEPDNAHVFPFAPDWRGDGCDADCGEEPDADGDDWPDAADCGPDDPAIFPCATEPSGTDGVDSDCGGQDGPRSDNCDYARPDPEFGADGTPELDADCNPV